MAIDAKTIQIFLPDGQPRGMRIAEITTRIVQAVQVPRTHLEKLFQRNESQHVGLYFLFGEREISAKPVAYIGQTEDLKSRLKKHHADKEFWKTAVVVISRTQSFTQSHIRYLEWLSIKQATEAGRYALDNANEGSKPFVPEPMEADVLDAFDTAGVLLSTLGYPLFEPPAGPAGVGKQRNIFYCSGPQASGKGELVEDGFAVLKGSLARKEVVRTAPPYIVSKRESLAANSVLVDEGESYRFVEDYLFDSPSGAAMMLLGRTANGWIEWKTEDGRTLSDVKRTVENEAETNGEENE